MFTIDKDSLRLPNDQYFQVVYPKKQIYIHHTVGGSARSTYSWWLNDKSKSGDELRVGTAYLIERDGTIYETFEPKFWAHHLGLKVAANVRLNQESIGIELCSEGALTKKPDGKIYCFDGARFQRDIFIDLEHDWRGYRYFDAYEQAQLASCFKLVYHLCSQFQIPKQVLKENRDAFDVRNFDFSGILGHCNVRADKTDPHPLFPWEALQHAIDDPATYQIV